MGVTSIKLAALALLLFAVPALALSSAQVLDAVNGEKGYLSQGESASLLLDRPLDVEGGNYWVVYTYLTSNPNTRNAYLVVDDASGALVTENDVLLSVFAVVAEYDYLTTLESNSLSADDLNVFLSEAGSGLDGLESKYRTIVTNQLADKYDTFDFSPLQTGLEDLRAKHDEARDSVNAVFEQRQTFKTFYSNYDLESYIKSYNESFSRFSAVSRASKAYDQAVRDKIDEATNSPTLNFSDKQQLKDGLEKLFTSGNYEAFYKSVVEPGSNKASASLAAARLGVARQAESTRYVVAKKEAEHAYSKELVNRVSDLLSSSNAGVIRSCGLDSAPLKEAWVELRALMENPSNSSIDSYGTVPAIAASVSVLADSLQSSLEECINAPNVDGTPAAPDYSLVYAFVLVVAVVGAAVVLYRRYRQAQEEQ